RREDIDVIVVARGGGSLEELWAFNDERVARAIANARKPVVCGVGHETDFSLADFAADRRAPTPSAAAEIVTPDQMDLRRRLYELSARLTSLMEERLFERRRKVTEQLRTLQHFSPAVRLVQARQQVDDLTSRLLTTLQHNLSLRRERLKGLMGRLEGVSPLATLERGYAIVRRVDDGQVVRSVAQVAAGDELRVRVSDGEFGARVGGQRMENK
ncbi:MAG TPA: exodeoxyribonuclease VII large subunit, partial [Thermoflexia bacterium]|nr:exodeoxyribonuclease VII large subunit [Thermoflexia bacterium]